MKVLQEVFVDGIHPKVASIDFDRLKWKLCKSTEQSMTVDEADFSEREYRRCLLYTSDAADE